ncbi:MAG: hypothetical protein A2756_03360 [Candidatus Ryanbacteria bacterium RIFCSPHIGHO2_01_FULL_48_27]|uniref:Uncharacterized protein n=1 Tax=Candidatus Ryanbacteria bacterium RIFCSPHIGHO2_01_FULL_48_27 TaxID=1802115 RepID=A0A1G2G4I6_9BACT|nr:MAG: hypothetical protein A2756_03360 [Candidatus Ryanbacteria bacterium RIFCSPHIGHO2_01_FULL_48_27]
MLNRKSLINEKPALPKDPKEIRNLAVRVTSGTTGMPLVRIRSTVSNAGDSVLPGRVLLSFLSADMQLGTLTKILYTSEPLTELFVSINPLDMDEKLVQTLADLHPDSVSSVAVAHLCEGFRDTELAKEILKITFGGELLTAEQELMFKNTFPNARILIFYRAREIGLLGTAECLHLKRNQFHAAPGVTLEIVDPDKKGIGCIVVSKKLPHGSLSQYEVGDRGKVIGTCLCGAETLEVLGRKNYVKIVGTLLLQEELYRVASDLSVYIEDYRTTAKEERVGGKTYGKIEMGIIPTALLKGRKNPEAFIANEITRRLFLTPSRTLAHLVAAGVFLPLQVYFTDVFEEKDGDVRLHRQ